MQVILLSAKQVAFKILQCIVFLQSFASDIFSLGCIFYFVATEGLHPFGDLLRRQVNILDGKYNVAEDNVTNPTYLVADFIKLLKLMISHEPKDRPSSPTVLQLLPNLEK